jgi:hypothetical protein
VGRYTDLGARGYRCQQCALYDQVLKSRQAERQVQAQLKALNHPIALENEQAAQMAMEIHWANEKHTDPESVFGSIRGRSVRERQARCWVFRPRPFR